MSCASHSEYEDTLGPIIYSGILYRGRRLDDVFLRRTGCLLGCELMTYHSEKDKEPTKKWFITSQCDVQGIRKEYLHVAPDNWTARGAHLFSTTHSVEAYVIKLNWPEEDEINNEPVFLGFESEHYAKKWREAFLKVKEYGAFGQSLSSSSDDHSRYSDSSSIHQQNENPVLPPVNGIDPRNFAKYRWKAIKELDGMVVYYDEDKTGGAYMVSTIIRSNPADCLDSLSTGSFLLSCSDVTLVRHDNEVEIIDLFLHPVGLGSWFLSPRNLRIERVWTKHPRGTVAVVFRSCHREPTSTSWWSWMMKPVEATIPAAGFVLCPVNSINGRLDTLLTMVLKIDFGGICSQNHLCKAFLDGFGICEDWTDRILMTVSKLKYTLEEKECQLQCCPSIQDPLRSAQIASFRRQSLCPSLVDPLFPPTQQIVPRDAGILNKKFWSNPGSAGFCIRGANYLEDKKKIPAEQPRFELDWVYLISLKQPTYGVAKYLPALKSGEADFTFVLQVMLPGPPYLSMVFGWTGQQPRSSDADAPATSSSESASLDPFEEALTRFLRSDSESRSSMFKLIPKIVEGGWMIRLSAGSTPVLTGTKLKQSYEEGNGYFEVDIDIASSKAAAAATRVAQGTTKSLTIDLAILIQGDKPEELPESLLGTVRLDHVDFGTAIPLDSIKTD